MASELRVDTLKDSSGNNSVGMAYVAEGSAKAWANLNGTGTIALRDSFNVASVTDAATGISQFSFSNNMSNANYSAPYIGGNGTTNGVDDTSLLLRPVTGNIATSSYRTAFVNTAETAFVDTGNINLAIHGDLA
jgi:hypothetical protein